MGIMPNLNLALSSNNNLDGCTLADNLIKSHQLDLFSSGFISAEAVDNEQEHLAAIRYSTPY